MVSVKDALGGLPLSATSSSSTSTLGSSSSASSSTTTQFHNVLTPGGSSGLELTQVQHYNDLQWPKSMKMKAVKDVNIKRGHDSSGLLPDVWKSTTARDYTHRKLSHQGTIRESDFYKETSLDINQIDTERNINLNVEPGAIHIGNDEKTNFDVRYKIKNTEVKTNIIAKESKDDPAVPVAKLERARSWWKGKLPLKASLSSSGQASSSVIRSSVRRKRFWNSLSKTLDLPDKLRREDKKVKKVPKLQIWLSTDSRGTELSDISEPSVLNNTRDAVPRIQLEQPKVINRSLIDSARWRALSEGSSPAVQEASHSGRSNIEGVNSGPKSPVEKQPTWPVCHLLQPRPKLRHQNCLNTQNAWNQEFLNKRLELPRQNAFSDDAETKDNDLSKSGDPQQDWKRGSFSTESQASTSILSSVNFGDSKWSLRPRLSTGGQATLGINLFFCRRGASSTSRSYSDEKSEIFDGNLEAGPNAAPSFNSVFSLTDTPSTPSLSWASSHASLHSDFPSGLQVDPRPDPRRDRSSSFNHELLTPNTGMHVPCKRSLSAASASIFNFGDKSQLRLTVPSSEGGRSRRPSLLSLRSMTRSPIPYVSMDYDYDSDYELLHAGGHGGLIPEATPKLSFTQKLAFPTLYQNSIDRPKPRDPYTEAENNMNTVAKIITVVILTFVTVFILGGLFKLLH